MGIKVQITGVVGVPYSPSASVSSLPSPLSAEGHGFKDSEFT